MKRKSIVKTTSWILLSTFFGFMPLWVKLMNSSIDISKIFNFSSILTDCSVLYFCSTATIGVCADYFYNNTNKYLLLRDLKNVIGLPIFIFSWTIVITLNISYMPEKNINLTTILLHTIIVTVATLVYIILMKFNEFSK